MLEPCARHHHDHRLGRRYRYRRSACGHLTRDRHVHDGHRYSRPVYVSVLRPRRSELFGPDRRAIDRHPRNPLLADVAHRASTECVSALLGPDYYNQLARAGTGRATRAWTRNPLLYIHTVDDQNRALDPQALVLAESIIRDTIGLWTGGRLQIAGVEYGNEDREGRAGTISVTWGGSSSELCGEVTVIGFEGTVIRMDTRTPGCRCAGLAIDPAVVRHELGHALGFTHTDRRDDLMNPTRSGSCAMTLSSREQQYANYMYSRPRGNTPVDNDPSTTVF